MSEFVLARIGLLPQRFNLLQLFAPQFVIFSRRVPMGSFDLFAWNDQ